MRGVTLPAICDGAIGRRPRRYDCPERAGAGLVAAG